MNTKNSLYTSRKTLGRTGCDGCVHYLGGGCCRLNAESECAAGGGYELYESEEEEGKYQNAIMLALYALVCALWGIFLYKLWHLIF